MTLRIESYFEGDPKTVRLSGRLKAENLPELLTLIEGEARSVVLDLKEVDLVDLQAIRFLARCKSRGVFLLNCSQYIESWIAREQECGPSTALE